MIPNNSNFNSQYLSPFEEGYAQLQPASDFRTAKLLFSEVPKEKLPDELKFACLLVRKAEASFSKPFHEVEVAALKSVNDVHRTDAGATATAVTILLPGDRKFRIELRYDHNRKFEREEERSSYMGQKAYEFAHELFNHARPHSAWLKSKEEALSDIIQHKKFFTHRIWKKMNGKTLWPQFWINLTRLVCPGPLRSVF